MVTESPLESVTVQLAEIRPTSPLTERRGADWEARVELAALYHAMDRLGMTDLIYNHITLRIPAQRDRFLINSYGMLYSEVTASSLFEIDADGNVISDPGTGFGFNPAGFVIHGAVHSAREDIACVLHTHTRATMAVSAMREGLLPISQQACMFDGCISYHDYNGPVLDLVERERLIRDLGENNVIMLRNHGALIGGATVAQTFLYAYFLELACKVQVDVMAAGRDIVIPSPPALENSRRLYREIMQDKEKVRLNGELEWHAMLRRLAAEGIEYAV
jgi:ribulose-5-phosphate 4-epimerase/fuculose-1-phosphate aldolase